eukprot:CAMPEP_0201215086 /NCGR_PEP_ID=MMETSP0851-20130426/188763_1 /ASSEMBLY_ACC=CAM_ASM_000631 /TAXON_ID=183588 /ORGANISM="Pseudo-nitzschia fraudulenta, Strain WWA7" /LENGTH=282 /DNA_ID=CAMNT_0047504501 /DNA_START=938 /DNA_END=1784 /DNA_ORIENTATION=-
MIHVLHRDHNLPSSFCHVRGHQDRDTAYSDLDLNAQLNVEADRLAAAFYDHPEANFEERVLPNPSCPAQLVIAGIDVTSNYKTLLIRAYTEPRYLEYLQRRFDWDDTVVDTSPGKPSPSRCDELNDQRRFDWDDTVVDTIAWKALSISLRRIERACLCTKICNDLLLTARILYRWNQQGHDSCSLCGRKETTTHMIVCNHPSRLKLRRTYIKTLRARLQRMNTGAGIIDTFCSAISDWFDNGAVDPNKYPTQYHQAIKQQTKIGWSHVFQGHLAAAWSAIQI